jgi:hypothetical protein
MKSLNTKILLIAILVFMILADELDPSYSFEDFRSQFHKNYDNEKQRQIHEKIFEKNYAELLKLKGEGHDVIVNEQLD